MGRKIVTGQGGAPHSSGREVERSHAALGAVIEAIGEPGFAAVAAEAVGRFSGFDLAVVVAHGPSRPSLVFDNFDQVGGGLGVRNYVEATHLANPMLREGPRRGAVRARDFASPTAELDGEAADRLMPAPEEELGFRTIGWPPRLEEVGLYFRSGVELIEFGLYRERSRSPASNGILQALGAMAPPLAAAFARHEALRCRQPSAAWREALSAREAEVADLLLAGCASEAVALRLGISRNTVKDHRKQIYRKLSISSLSELFALGGGHPLGG